MKIKSQYIGIEAGGTKFVCTYGRSPKDIQERTVITTTTPDQTMHEVIQYIQAVQQKVPISAIGAGVFGPLDVDSHSQTYGYITTTPKVGWQHFDFLGTLKRIFPVPFGFDTDVNAAVLGEYRWGAAAGLSDVIYLTIGTGIGGGIIANHKLVHGAMHPEMGHILIGKNEEQDPLSEGICQYHQHCLEGLASGPAMKIRWNVTSALDLPEDHRAWDLEAYYLGIALANYTLILSPKRIILGGGVMRQQHLLAKIRTQLLLHLRGYIKNSTVVDGINEYVVQPGLGENSGICGAIALAEKAYLTHIKDRA